VIFSKEEKEHGKRIDCDGGIRYVFQEGSQKEDKRAGFLKKIKKVQRRGRFSPSKYPSFKQ
jgi:hypothetical protein